jgi:hypothetical protein
MPGEQPYGVTPHTVKDTCTACCREAACSKRYHPKPLPMSQIRVAPSSWCHQDRFVFGEWVVAHHLRLARYLVQVHHHIELTSKQPRGVATARQSLQLPSTASTSIQASW